MSCTSTLRRRRIIAAALALPLSLAMTGSALAGGGPTVDRGSVEALARTGTDSGAGKAAADRAAADRAAADRAAADRAAADRAAADRAARDQAAADAAADERAAEKAAADKAAARHAEAARAQAAKAAKDEASRSAAPAEQPAKAQPAKAEPARTQPAPARDSSSDPAKHGTPTSGPLTKPQPLSKADKNGTGANPGTSCTHSYCSTRDGSPSGNGVGDGAAKGKPCAGCVGKADNKNPKGQAPDGTDRNAGYECDRNQGIGKTNPAHTGCSPSATDPGTTPGTGPDKGNGGGGGNGNGGGKATCPGSTIPMPPGGAKNCPSDRTPPGNGTGNGGGNGGKATCPGSTIPMPPGGAKNCPSDGTRPGNGTGNERITICHATGSRTNPYVMISPSKKGVLNGHVGSDHQDGRDIIPPFSYVERGVTKSFPGQGDQSLLARGCVVPAPGGGGDAAPGTGTCPNGQVMPGGNPANCPTAPPVCPTGDVVGPVMAGCETEVPPSQGGGTPIGGTPPAQPGTGPIGGTPPAQPGTGPVPVGPPTGVVPPTGSNPVTIVPNTGVGPSVVTVGSRVPATRTPSSLPFTGTDAALLIELGLLLLLAGGGALVVARRERTARAV